MPGRGSSKKVRDTDKGYKKRLRQIFNLKPTSLTVGIHAEEGAKTHEQREYDERTTITVLDIGTIHEFGLGNNPERSFIRGWADENKEKNQKTISKLMQSVVAGKRTIEDATDIIGLRFVGDVQRRMRDSKSWAKELKKRTIDRKGSDVPLIDTGQLRSSIQYKVGYGRK
jgi:hypothetical protein